MLAPHAGRAKTARPSQDSSLRSEWQSTAFFNKSPVVL